MVTILTPSSKSYSTSRNNLILSIRQMFRTKLTPRILIRNRWCQNSTRRPTWGLLLAIRLQMELIHRTLVKIIRGTVAGDNHPPLARIIKIHLNKILRLSRTIPLQSTIMVESHPKENSCKTILVGKGRDPENHSLTFIWETHIPRREIADNSKTFLRKIISRLWPKKLLIVVNQAYKVIMLEPQFPKRFQLLKMHKLFSQDRRAKSSTIVSRNSRLLLRLVIHQRTLTRSTRIRSWFCHISESIEGPISSPLLMDMVSMVNLLVSTLRLSLHRRSNSPLSTHSIRLKLTRE